MSPIVLIASALLVSLLSGCAVVYQPYGFMLNHGIKNNSRNLARIEILRKSHLDMIKNLQKSGDPMGDYLWVEANDKKLTDKPITDPQVIKNMYADLAAKGSVDAKIVLGLKTFAEGGSLQHRTREVKREESTNTWQSGLVIVEEATATRCWFYSTILNPGLDSSCMTSVSAAQPIWLELSRGERYPKNDALVNYWKMKDDACKASPTYQEARKSCPPR